MNKVHMKIKFQGDQEKARLFTYIASALDLDYPYGQNRRNPKGFGQTPQGPLLLRARRTLRVRRRPGASALRRLARSAGWNHS